VKTSKTPDVSSLTTLRTTFLVLYWRLLF